MSKLLVTLDALQDEIGKETAALEGARASIAKTEKDLSDYLLAEEARLLEIRRLLSNGKSSEPIKQKFKGPKDPKGKDLYGDMETSTYGKSTDLNVLLAERAKLQRKAVETAATIDAISTKALIALDKDAKKKPFNSDDYRPKGKPTDLGSIEKADGSVVRWWSYSERPKMAFLFSGELLIGAWGPEAKTYRRASNGSVVDEPVATPPVPLPKE
jgi:hypothetical protein